MSYQKVCYLVSCEELVRTSINHKLKCSIRISNALYEMKKEHGTELEKELAEDELNEAEQNYEFAEKSFQNALELWEKAFSSVRGNKPVAYANTLESAVGTLYNGNLPG